MKMKDVVFWCCGILIWLNEKTRYWLWFLLHMSTVFIIWKIHGFLIGALSLFFPCVSEVYVFIREWMKFGFLNPYTFLMFAVTLLSLLPYAIVLILSKISNDNNTENNK